MHPGFSGFGRWVSVDLWFVASYTGTWVYIIFFWCRYQENYYIPWLGDGDIPEPALPVVTPGLFRLNLEWLSKSPASTPPPPPPSKSPPPCHKSSPCTTSFKLKKNTRGLEWRKGLIQSFCVEQLSRQPPFSWCERYNIQSRRILVYCVKIYLVDIPVPCGWFMSELPSRTAARRILFIRLFWKGESTCGISVTVHLCFPVVELEFLWLYTWGNGSIQNPFGGVNKVMLNPRMADTWAAFLEQCVVSSSSNVWKFPFF